MTLGSWNPASLTVMMINLLNARQRVISRLTDLLPFIKPTANMHTSLTVCHTLARALSR